MGKSLAVFWNRCILLKSFRVKNAKIDIVMKKMVLSVVFVKLKCIWLQNSLPALKNTKQLKITLVDHYAISIFWIFEIFDIHQ